MLQHKDLTPQQSHALMIFYTWAKTKDAVRMTHIKEHFGLPLFRILGNASMCNSVTKFEEDMRLPPRSGKVVLGMAADLLSHYLKDSDTLVG